MRFPLDRLVLASFACCPFITTILRADILVDLDATSLPAGPLVNWSNSGTLGGNFTKGADTPVVTVIHGVKGVTLDGSNDWYDGPVAPASVVGNGSRTVTAWIFNPAVNFEETVVAWSRREGPDRSGGAFFHGNHDAWGAFGGWGAGDVGWSNQEISNAWTCCTWVYDANTSTMRVYTDGVLSTSKSIGPLNTWAVSTSGSPLPIRLGAQSSANGSATSINSSMTIARVRVHDEALSATEVSADYNAEAGLFVDAFSASPTVVHAGSPATLSWLTDSSIPVSISPAVTIPGGAGSVQVSPLQTTTYTFTATVGGDTRTCQATVTVLPGAPVADDLEIVVPQGSPSPVTLSATDPNPSPGGLSWEILQAPASGGLSGTAPDLTYTPNGGFHGTDTFTYRAGDGIGFSNTATVTIHVNPPPTDPSGISVSEPEISTSAVSGSFVANLAATDPNFGETHTYQLVAGAGDTGNALFSIVGNQLVAQSGFAGLAGTVFSIRVRVTDSSGRSFDQILPITAVETARSVVINEILYNPAGNTRTEFIELHNPTAAPIDISGWQFTKGISFTFPPGTSLAAGGYAAVSMDPAAFLTEFGSASYGPYIGGLSSDGEKVELSDSSGGVIDVVEYSPEFPWPVGAGGNGPSIELIHPSLDNNLGGSWRSSISVVSFPELNYIDTAASGWKWRPGNTEASSPTSAWRQNGFVEDGTWTSFQAPIGYGEITSGDGTLNLNTTISGMQGNYRCIFARKTFTIAPGAVPANLLLRYSQDDGIVIWINGTLVDSRNLSTTEPTISTLATNNPSEGLWYEKNITNAATYLVEGVNTVAVQVVNTELGSSDIGFDLKLTRVASTSALQPTPGYLNTVFSATAPPQIRQVKHSPEQPVSGEPVTITAKVTDPQGIGSVRALYQTVAPGQFIPARFPRPASQILADPYGERPVNPAFENPANWTSLTMVDDGSNGDAVAADGVFTANIPAQAHRTLVRYRIVSTDIPGASVQVPYADDPSLNFAYFVYDGVPDYVASSASVAPGGAGKVWPKELLTSLPVYHWIIRAEDMLTLNAYNGSEQLPNSGDALVLAARRTEDWEGAFVYDGVVYDHVTTRLRGGNSRYGDNEGRFTRGKRHYKFKFNDGHRFQARDQSGKPYPQKWKSLAFSKMFGNKGGNNWGMTEEIGATLWSTFGVPAANTFWFHFRVIDGAAEAPDQYNGDFWGIQQVVEEYESTFLDARGMTKGNLYKMSDWIWDADRQRRYQSPDMVRDGSEFNNIRDNLHGGQNGAWLEQYVNYDKWYRYSAVAEAIRHYDLFPYTDDIRHSLKNVAWYFEPTGADPTRGVCWWLPYDWDASFGPNWNNGWEHANNALYGWDMSTSNGMPYVNKPEMKLEHRNVIREFRDLVWQADQLNGLIDDRAAVIAGISMADQDRWRNAPASSGYAIDDTLAYKVADMKSFSFTGWSGETGPTVDAGGRAAYLTGLADNPDAGLLPATPVITYTGDPAHAINQLEFETTGFSDPQGAGTFGAMAWRIGEIEDPTAPAHDPADDYILEYTPVWESGELAWFQDEITIPAGALKPGHTYRARVRMRDNTGRWSHWSAPYQFTAAAPDGLPDLQQNLMITEVMYNPSDDADQLTEYLELRNISSTLTLDLTEVRFTKGVDFDFEDSAITSLAPGETVLVVKNLAAFESRHGSGLPVAGEWESGASLSNGGEQVKLSYGSGVAIHDFTYDDAVPWPTEPDGAGPAMALVDPMSAPDHAVAANWTAAIASPGSTGAPDDPFGDWLALQGGTDPMAEVIPGMSYLMMYALGADLVADPLSANPNAGYLTDLDGVHLTLSFRKRIDAGQLSYVVETSTALDSWQSGSGIVEPVGSPLDNGDGTETVTVRVVGTVTGHPVRFIRLRVDLME